MNRTYTAPTLEVERHIFDQEITTGEWCPTCDQPSAVCIPWVAVDAFTLAVLIRALSFTCRLCTRRWCVTERGI